MTKRRKILSILMWCLPIGLAFAGFIYLVGLNVEPRVQLTVREFEWEHQPFQIVLRFESDDGAFTTGNVVHIHGLVLNHSTNFTGNKVSVYFPNTITTDQFNELKDDTQWISHPIEGGEQIDMPYGLTSTPSAFDGLFPEGQIDKIWTQEGLQDGYIIIENASKPINPADVGQINLKNATKLDKIINIESSDVLQNIKTNNTIAGATLAIIALTISAGIKPYAKFS